MKTRYRLTRRGSRGDTFYCKDTLTGKRTSLATNDEDAAEQIVLAKNQAERQPILNLQIARAYLMGADKAIGTRTWRDAVTALTETKLGSNKDRWITAQKDKAFAPLWSRALVETQGEELLKVMRAGCVSTNTHLRRLHNFCVDMNWLPWPLVPKRQWPAIRHKEKRAITWEEHARIVEREGNAERKAFYQLAWYLGPSQGDLANLHAEDIDWASHTITYVRMKTKWRENQTPPQVKFGQSVAEILRTLPKAGPLFPYLRGRKPGYRANEFRERCLGLGIHGVSLHSYRYAWAERAKTAGYPERFAQLALGHNSKAVHRAYARKARVTLPALEDYEKNETPAAVITLPVSATA
ncbi:tyrosine-type recombinase/integrase [Oleiharenicola lentus]|uniref:tyrosine-type recombinase/integrase n=1 Tax=Oleiharenicola lentus TaxID=2508720 RepID=UPI003F67E4BD